MQIDIIHPGMTCHFLGMLALQCNMRDRLSIRAASLICMRYTYMSTIRYLTYWWSLHMAVSQMKTLQVQVEHSTSPHMLHLHEVQIGLHQHIQGHLESCHPRV